MPEIESRKSTRVFSQRPVEDAVLQKALYAARWAPSSGNQQPWRWVVVTDGASREALNAALNPGNAWAKQAPILFALLSHPDLDHRLEGRDYFLFDSGLSAMSLILQCVHSGLVAHPMVGFNEAKAREALGIPDDYRVLILVAAGYPGNPETDADEETRAKDAKQRTRYPPYVTVFKDRWGTPFLEEDSRP